MWLSGLTAIILGVKLTQTNYSEEPCQEVERTEEIFDAQSVIGNVSVFCRFIQGYKDGWTTIHQRFDGTMNFTRSWDDYREGFGDLQGEYWLGLDNVHHITRSGPFELMVIMKDYNDERMWATYDKFAVLSEKDHYQLDLGRFSEGNVEDSLKLHNGMKFSTADRDNDLWSGNCAELYESGWWFKDCHAVNLNGVYQNETEYDKMMWGKKCLKEAQMLIRITKSNE
uniref:Putative ficolin n=1 Tax=Aedes albopictus TaxID=7160 RepID=A0A023EMH9_AEDAL